MAGFFDSPDPNNPFLPSGAQTLFSALTNLGAGISAASARNLPFYFGIAPGAQAFTNAYGNTLARGMNYDLQNKRLGLEQETADINKQYREAQIADLKHQADIDAALMKGLPTLLGGGAASSPPGMRVQRSLLGPDFTSSVASDESGGRYDAVNPTSGATGKFQFMPDTWTQVAAFHPELGLPMDVHKATPQQQEAAMQAFTADNAKFLTAHGVQPTEANLYLAHRFGAQGAVDFLSAPDDAPVASVLPASWVAQNPDLQGVTVGQFKAGVGQRYAGAGSAPGAPQLPGPPPNNLDLAPFALSKRFGPLATMIANNRNAQYQDAWKRYQAGIEQKKLEQQIHSGEVIQLPDGTWGVNPAFVAAEGAKAKAAGTDTGSQMALVDYKAVSKQNTDLQNAGMKARTRIANLDRLEQLGKDLDTGWGAEAIANFKAMAKGAGLDITSFGLKDNVGQAQAFRALSNEFALQMRDTSQGTGMPGAMSDNDVKILQSMIPSLSMTPEGRAYLTETMKRMAQRQVDMAKIATDFMRSPEAKKDPNALYDKLNAYAESHPVWSQDDLKKAEGLQKANRRPITTFEPQMQSNGFATNPNPNAPTNMPKRSIGTFDK